MKMTAGLFLILLICSFATVAQSRWAVLFDGKSTAAWRGYKRDSFPEKGWAVENGALKTIVGGDRVDLITREKYRDFELELEWRVSPAGNSGIIYLVSEDEPQTYQTGPEMQVLDDAAHRDGQNSKTSAGSLYALIAPENKKLQPVGEWNKARLVIRNGHVEHWLNAVKLLEYELGSEKLKGLIAESKFKDMPRFAQNREGHIALQHHGEEVWYRNIRIRRL
ncbi:MAG TPA: DUF1080 domain-containing protein [Blastocatellia bacterium]|nr:DUF1080 domain-containing protein [Blastocatellia bacterium]